MPTINNRHGGPHDRGSADAYYGRAKEPHYYTGATGTSERIEAPNMTTEQIAEYNHGYDTTDDRKDWG